MPEKSSAPDPSDVTVFVLCGGLGTRLRGVEARPKSAVVVSGLPFLYYALRLLGLQGFRKVRLLVGHGAEQLLETFGLAGDEERMAVEESILAPLELSYSLETEPMGTGGALGMARDYASDLNLVLNGDSYAESIYTDLIATHLQSTDHPGATLLGVWENQRADYGGLTLSSDPPHRVEAFLEKGEVGAGWINGGVYLFDREIFDRIPTGKSSLEHDLLPGLSGEGRLLAQTSRCFFRDIGTPDRLREAQTEFGWIRRRMKS